MIAATVFAALAGCSKGGDYAREAKNSSIQESATLNQVTKSDVIVKSAAGDIDSALNEFRDLLGNLNVAPGATSGRREVNWDAVPANLTDNNAFPGNFFGSFDATLPNGRKRGLIMTTPGSGFSISDDNFFEVNPSYQKQFQTFSPSKTIIAVGSTITDNFFKIPGTNTDATVQGFGVVFSDVNNSSSTSMEFYNGDVLLGSFKVPHKGNNTPGSFSFLGVYFPNEKITRVRINSGNAPLGADQDDISDGSGKDLVIMDDFIYSEPKL